MTEDELIALAVRHNLGRTMKPLGMQTGDVFVTDQSYRTGELLAFAAAVADAERERCAKVRHALLNVLTTMRDELRNAGYLTSAADEAIDLANHQSEQPTPQPARKMGGSYQADGVVLVRFATRAGAKRVVFEFDSPAGMLHIFNEDQIEEIWSNDDRP